MSRDLPPFSSLAGQVLIAMPGMVDDRFERSVIYICTHTENDGAMGIVMNHPAEKLLISDVLDQLNIPLHGALVNKPVFLGGPVRRAQGFILHTADYTIDSTSSIANGIALTATHEVLRDTANGQGPMDFLFAIGCATWIRGQLEEEIMTNGWLTVVPTHDLIFKTSYLKQWEKALSLLGIKPGLLSAESGKA